MHFRIFYIMFLSFNCLSSESGGCDRISREMMFLSAFEATTHSFFSVMFSFTLHKSEPFDKCKRRTITMGNA